MKLVGNGIHEWSFCFCSIVAPPITWMQDGEQYLSVVAGWGGAVPLWGGDVAALVKDFNQGGTVWTFKLPKSAELASN